MPAMSSDSFYGYLLGHPSASKGGHARAKSLNKAQRKSIASKAAKTRWSLRAPIEKATEDPLASINKPIVFFE